jgi:hypothetical protein
MQLLIAVLVGIVIFAILAFGMKWICDTFFAGFRPAYWICGVVLLIVLLIAVSTMFSGGTLAIPGHWTR